VCSTNIVRGGLNFGSAGSGTGGHLSMEMFMQDIGMLKSDVQIWFGLVTRAGTPQPIFAKFRPRWRA
jgi:hypothetical protein